MKIGSFLTSLGAILLMAGCAYDRPYYSYNPATTHGGEVISSNNRDFDHSLEIAVRDQINRYGDLAAASQNVQIYSRNGSVTLTGSIPTERDKQLIDTITRNTAGVSSVSDRLQVGYSPTGGYSQPPYVYNPSTPTAMAPSLQVQPVSDADRILAQRISENLRADPVLPTLTPAVTATVADGKVILQGTVSSQKQKRAIIDAVKRSPGVTSVQEDIDVR